MSPGRTKVSTQPLEDGAKLVLVHTAGSYWSIDECKSEALTRRRGINMKIVVNNHEVENPIIKTLIFLAVVPGIFLLLFFIFVIMLPILLVGFFPLMLVAEMIDLVYKKKRIKKYRKIV
jgi:hypothetical protein